MSLRNEWSKHQVRIPVLVGRKNWPTWKTRVLAQLRGDGLLAVFEVPANDESREAKKLSALE